MRESHNGKGTRLYTIWSNMKARCNNSNHPQYSNYGGRGIAIHQSWNDSFIEFREWANRNSYDDSLSIDRINNEDGYNPDNCRWTCSKTQNNNKRSNIIIDDTTLTLKCEELGVDPRLIQARMREQEMSFDEAIKLPQNFRHYKISYQDKEYNLKELCNELNLEYDTVYKRIKKYGWSLEKATEFKACNWILEQSKCQN